jgi:erythromycin esterase
MKRFLLGFILLMGVALAQSVPPEVTWLRENVIPITTVQAGSNLTDLEPISTLVGDARIVGLGEATHGTREFFLAKHRLLEFLVTKHDFRVFAMEANWASSFALNDYVLGGTGNARKLLQQYARIMWAWRTEEVLELIEWMRVYNQSTTQKIMFTGFDMQEPVPAVDWLVNWLETNAKDQATRTDELLSCIRFSLGNILSVARYTATGANGVARCATQIDTVRRILQNRRSNFKPNEYQTALQMVRVLEQANAYYKARFVTQDLLEAVTIRDAFMAENAAWLEKITKQKIVTWAHNGHVTFNQIMHFGWKPMGAYLREQYQDKYRVWGFAFFEGSFYAQLLDSNDPARTIAAAALGLAANPSVQRVPNPSIGSYEILFRAINIPIFMLDLRRSSTPAGAWLKKPRRLQIIGQNLPPFREPEPDWYSYQAVLSNDFDAIIYIDKTTPSTPI